jgi:hypothetical protein
MGVKSRWKMVVAVPLPSTAWAIGALVSRRQEPDMVITLGLAVLAGLFGLAAIAIIERERTKRARLPYEPQIRIAKAKARMNIKYARAQTRRTHRLGGGEQYSPKSATISEKIGMESVPTEKAPNPDLPADPLGDYANPNGDH